MIMSQRYPSYFDGIVSGDPAIRTGHSNMALAFIGSTFAKAAQQTSGKADYKALFSDSDKKLVLDALLNACDANDGIKDGMIFGKCNFDPATLNCQGAKTDACLLPAQTAALKTALAGPKDSHGNATYAAFPYDVGIAEAGRGTPGLLSGPSIPVPVKIGTDFDVDAENYKLVTDYNARLGDSLYTNLSSYFGHNGKLIFYHGLSDAWFSSNDTLGYYERMASDNGGAEKVSSSSRLFMVPGMAHCNGGAATLDQFDMLTAITDWVERGTAPESVVATGRSFPGRSRPICAYPSYAQYTGQGDPNDAKNFVCKKP
jgi:feruloyl esterase